ncbi:hypothetical protein MCOR30_011747, partial [Pyricularia oryzae]
MASEIVSALTFIIQFGVEVKDRLDSLNQAADELKLLNVTLVSLLKAFENPTNKINTEGTEFLVMLEILDSIKDSCKKCANALDKNRAGATDATKIELYGKKFFKRLWTLYRIPDILTEIQHKAAQLQQISMAVVVASTLVVSDVRTQQGQISGKEIVESAHIVKETTLHYLSTDLASIDQMMGNLMKECTNLRQQLQEATLLPDTSAIQIYQAQNPEAASFWKDRFQSDELNVSAFRYEASYGMLVECERASGDLALPAAIESPSDHVGWISAQIVAVPAPDELGIITEREVMKSNGEDLFAYFNDAAPDVHVYVRYLQTGQIERKSLSKQVRPIGGINIGATLSVR